MPASTVGVPSIRNTHCQLERPPTLPQRFGPLPAPGPPHPRNTPARGTGRYKGDSLRVKQLLLNLGQNASQAGAAHVRVLIDKEKIRVVDDGPGIPDDLHEKIFEPFFTTKTRGTGLGLPIARKMVEGMGGTRRVAGPR